MSIRFRRIPTLAPQLVPSRRYIGFAIAVLAQLSSAISPAGAQWVATYRQAALHMPAENSFAQRDLVSSTLLNAVAAARAITRETVWQKRASDRPDRENLILTETARLMESRPRFEPGSKRFSPSFTALVPEAAAAIDWARSFERQLYDVLANEGATDRDRDARVMALLEYYTSRPELALATAPKSPDVVDGQIYGTAFRRAMPHAAAQQRAQDWVELAYLERLMLSSEGKPFATSVEATTSRFYAMTASPAAAPRRLPLAPGVAPAFERRFPNAGSVIDNLHLFEDAISSILVSEEIPRSAKRLEILRALDEFRSDSTMIVDYALWLRAGDLLGVANMGGPADATASGPVATADPSASIAGLVPVATDLRTLNRPTPATDTASMAGMAMSMTPDTTLQLLVSIHQRMMADPVIRERAATDPTLQAMLKKAAPIIGGGGDPMPGMASPGSAAMPNMAGMPGMTHASTDTSHDVGGVMRMDISPTAASRLDAVSRALSAGTAEERAAAIDFAVRLLSDPAIQSRIHSSPELHKMWSEPAVQQRLDALKRERLNTSRNKTP